MDSIKYFIKHPEGQSREMTRPKDVLALYDKLANQYGAAHLEIVKKETTYREVRCSDLRKRQNR